MATTKPHENKLHMSMIYDFCNYLPLQMLCPGMLLPVLKAISVNQAIVVRYMHTYFAFALVTPNVLATIAINR